MIPKVPEPWTGTDEASGRPERRVLDSVGDMTIMTRTLGGTGAEVTILGYGAMEL